MQALACRSRGALVTNRVPAARLPMGRIAANSVLYRSLRVQADQQRFPVRRALKRAKRHVRIESNRQSGFVGLTRYEPYSIEAVPDLFHGLFRPLRGIATGDDAPLADMKLDVTENDTAYMVKAELPGVDKKDIDVKIDGNTVSISAKAERNKELKEGKRVLRRERYSGAISRSFSLASDVDEATAVAQHQDGVLSLTLPKKAASSQKRLEIS